MSNCNYCDKPSDGFPYKCKFCGSNFCSNHRLPESHNCHGLEKWKENKSLDKLIYNKNKNDVKKEFDKRIIIILILALIGIIFLVSR